MSAQEPSRAAAAAIEAFGLEPLPEEGGYFRRIFESAPSPGEGAAGDAGRPMATTILFLVTPVAFSAWHRLGADELYQFLEGDPFELMRLRPDGEAVRSRLGRERASGEALHATCPAGDWQAGRPAPDGEAFGYSLVSATMSPGFVWGDFEAGRRRALIERYPGHRELIEAFARD